MKNKITQLQQGDVLFKRISELPKTATPAKYDPRGIVLADGEVTGHAHVIEDIDDATLYLEGERMLLALEKQKTVVHQEHGPVTLEPGVWEIGRVVEEDELGDMRNVQD